MAFEELTLKILDIKIKKIRKICNDRGITIEELFDVEINNLIEFWEERYKSIGLKL